MQTRLRRRTSTCLVELRPRKSEIELAALYRRRDAVVSLIRSLERYRRATAGHIPGCSRRASRPPPRGGVMRNEYRAGPIYRAGLIVSGGMCAGLGIAILVALALHRAAYARLLPASVSTPPAAALGFAACGLALIGIGFWFPRVTSVLAMVTLSMAVVLVAERAFGLGPRVETLIAANLGAGDWAASLPTRWSCCCSAQRHCSCAIRTGGSKSGLRQSLFWDRSSSRSEWWAAWAT